LKASAKNEARFIPQIIRQLNLYPKPKSVFLEGFILQAVITLVKEGANRLEYCIFILR
jgi:hypothetical protein